MQIKHLEECSTTAGAVATVAQPFKAVQQRAPATKAKGSNLLKGIKTSKKFVNSISEGIQQCSECGCAVCECMMTENEAAPNTDQILYALTDAARHIANSDAYGTDGKRTISALYDLMRTPLKAGDLAGFEKAYDYCLRKYPDEASELIDTMYQSAKLGDQGTYEEFMAKMHEGAKVDRMVGHVKSSEKKLGKSAKEAENIAWATANKRGMLDNKNKKEGVAEGFGDYIGRKLQVKTTKGKPDPKNAPRWASALGQTPQGAWHWLEKDGPLETPDSDRYFPLSGKTEFTGFGSDYKDEQGVAEADDKKEWQKQNAKPKQLGKTEKYFSTRHTTKDTGAADKEQGVAEGNDWNGPLYDPTLQKGKPTKAATAAANAEADYRKKQKAFQKPTKQQGQTDNRQQQFRGTGNAGMPRTDDDGNILEHGDKWERDQDGKETGWGFHQDEAERRGREAKATPMRVVDLIKQVTPELLKKLRLDEPGKKGVAEANTQPAGQAVAAQPQAVPVAPTAVPVAPEVKPETDPELRSAEQAANIHYSSAAKRNKSLEKFLLRSVKHAKEADTEQNIEIRKIKRDMDAIRQMASNRPVAEAGKKSGPINMVGPDKNKHVDVSANPSVAQSNDPELRRKSEWAQRHYGATLSPDEAMNKWMQRGLDITEKNDKRHDAEIAKLMKEIVGLKRIINNLHPHATGASNVAEGEITEDDVVLSADRRRPKSGLLSKPEQAMNPADVVKLDVPLLIRLLEFAKEDAADDMALHDLAEKLVARGARGRTLTMKDYDSLVPSTPEAPAPAEEQEDFEGKFNQEMDEGPEQHYAKDPSGSYRNLHTGRLHTSPGSADGNDSYMTPAYMLVHYKKRLSDIEASKYRRPREVAQLKAKIAKLSGQSVTEGLGKDIKRLATGKDVKSRAGQEIAKSQDASMKGDHKTSKKHFDRYDKLDKLANKEQSVAEGDVIPFPGKHREQNDRLYGYPIGSENSKKFRQLRKEAEYYTTGNGEVHIPAAKYYIQQRVRGMDKGQAEVLTAKNFGDEINAMSEVSDTTVKSYLGKAMTDTITGKKDRNPGMKRAISRLAGTNKPLTK